MYGLIDWRVFKNSSLSFGEISKGMELFRTLLSENFIAIRSKESADEARMLFAGFIDSIFSIGNHFHLKVRPLIPNSFPLMAYFTVEIKYPNIKPMNRNRQISIAPGLQEPSMMHPNMQLKNAIINKRLQNQQSIFDLKYLVSIY